MSGGGEVAAVCPADVLLDEAEKLDDRLSYVMCGEAVVARGAERRWTARSVPTVKIVDIFLSSATARRSSNECIGKGGVPNDGEAAEGSGSPAIKDERAAYKAGKSVQ